MGASAYVGRVGGLAVALGVGAAVVLGGAGTAWAEDSAGDPTSQQQEQSGGTAGQAPDGEQEQGDQEQEEASSDEEAAPEEDLDEPDAEEFDEDPDAGDEAGAAEAADKAEVVEEAPISDEVIADPTNQGGGGAEGSTPPPEDGRGNQSNIPLVAEKVQQSRPPAAAGDAVVVANAARRVGEQPGVGARNVPIQTKAVTADSVRATMAWGAAPVLQAISAPPAPATVVPFAGSLLAALGLGSLSNLPSLPSPAWALGALMALGSRREAERSVSTQSVAERSESPTAPPTMMSLAAAAPYDPATGYVVTPVAVSTNTDRITNVTGPGGLNNTMTRFGIGGTDLGIMWDNGIRDNPNTPVNENQVLIAFGDTFANQYPVRTGGWRNNTLFRSSDRVLSNGMYVPNGVPHDIGMYSGSPMTYQNFSREIIGKYGYAVGPEVTIIPTAAISVPGAGANGATRQYVQIMSVRSWDTPGRWTTNYSAIAYSDDNGQNWTVMPRSSVRPAAAGRSTVPFVNGDQNFQQGAFMRKYTAFEADGQPKIDPATGRPMTDGYIYAYGTPAGRGGTAYLSRVKEADILDKSKYEYYNGSGWTYGNPAAAKPILPGTTSAGFFGFGRTTTYPSVSEMSVQYNAYEKKYIMLYGDQNNNIVMRKADSPEGPWSAPTTLVTSAKNPGQYAPYIHPWSSTPNLTPEEQKYLFWTVSTWDDYQVKLMRTDLSKV